jgi:hypothetical protein
LRFRGRLADRYPAAGMLFLPEFAMAPLTAALFGRLLLTRWTAVLAVTGMGVLAGGAAVLTGAARGSDWLVVAGSALVALAGFAGGLLVWLLGRARLSEPEVEPWLAGEEPAIPSSCVLAVTRR